MLSPWGSRENFVATKGSFSFALLGMVLPKNCKKVRFVLEGVLGFFLVEMSSQHCNIYISTTNEDQGKGEIREQCQHTVFSIGDQEKEEVPNAKHQRALHGVVPMHQG